MMIHISPKELQGNKLARMCSSWRFLGIKPSCIHQTTYILSEWTQQQIQSFRSGPAWKDLLVDSNTDQILQCGQAHHPSWHLLLVNYRGIKREEKDVWIQVPFPPIYDISLNNQNLEMPFLFWCLKWRDLKFTMREYCIWNRVDIYTQTHIHT